MLRSTQAHALQAFAHRVWDRDRAGFIRQHHHALGVDGGTPFLANALADDKRRAAQVRDARIQFHGFGVVKLASIFDRDPGDQKPEAGNAVTQPVVPIEARSALDRKSVV